MPPPVEPPPVEPPPVDPPPVDPPPVPPVEPPPVEPPPVDPPPVVPPPPVEPPVEPPVSPPVPGLGVGSVVVVPPSVAPSSVTVLSVLSVFSDLLELSVSPPPPEKFQELFCL